MGDNFKIECPTGSGNEMTLWEVATELSKRLISLFERDDAGPAAGVRRDGEISDGSALWRFDSVSRVFPWGQWRGAWGEPSDGVDGAGGEADTAKRKRTAARFNRRLAARMKGCMTRSAGATGSAYSQTRASCGLLNRLHSLFIIQNNLREEWMQLLEAARGAMFVA